MGDVLKQIDERRQVIFTFLRINIVSNRNEVNIVLCKQHFREHSHLKIVTTETGQILDDHALDLASFYIRDHPLKVRPSKVRAGKTVIHIELVVGVAVVLAVAFQHFFLVYDAVAITIVRVIHRKSCVQRGRFIRSHNRLKGHQIVEVRHHRTAPPFRRAAQCSMGIFTASSENGSVFSMRQ